MFYENILVFIKLLDIPWVIIFHYQHLAKRHQVNYGFVSLYGTIMKKAKSDISNRRQICERDSLFYIIIIKLKQFFGNKVKSSKHGKKHDTISQNSRLQSQPFTVSECSYFIKLLNMAKSISSPLSEYHNSDNKYNIHTFLEYIYAA